MKKLVPLILLAFSPSLFIFFSADDWFHLRISRINSLWEFFNFFSFSRTAQSIAFYRPLPTQVFFFIFQKIFGLNPFPYHLFVLTSFSISLYLIYHLGTRLLNSKHKALTTTLIYGFSVSNFTHLYFLSAFQETVLVAFSLLCILAYIDKRISKSVLFFTLALLSKETAVVIPLVLFVIDWSHRKVNPKKLLPFTLVLIPYLYLRLFIFGLAVGDTYSWNFSLIKAVNTLIWYFLWALGSPEFLIDYIGSAFRPIPRFFTDYPLWWPVILGLLVTSLIILVFLLIKKVSKIDRQFIALCILFPVSLLPVLFLPQHKFALELGLPLIWFSLAVTWILPNNGIGPRLFIVSYLILNLSMNYLSLSRHYSIGRAKISNRVFRYFRENFPKEPTNSYIEFINDSKAYTKEWGSSRQIANSTGGSELFRVLYDDPSYHVYFEDLPTARPNSNKISISTKLFLK